MMRVFIGFMLFNFASLALAHGDPDAGEKLAVVCSACHGSDGNSPAGSFPSIAGQNARYLVKQLMDIRNGDRSAPLMTGLLDGFSDADLRDIAAFYAKQTAKSGVASPELVEAGEEIYRAGIKRKQIAACSACHSPTGQGNGPAAFPALAGQWPEYIEAQLKAFRSGERTNDGESRMMRLTAMDMSDKEIEAVSSYIRGLR